MLCNEAAAPYTLNTCGLGSRFDSRLTIKVGPVTQFADANYKNLQRVAAPLAAMADDSQAAEQSLVDALMKAARECFARQSQQAAAAQQLREMLPSPDRDLGVFLAQCGSAILPSVAQSLYLLLAARSR